MKELDLNKLSNNELVDEYKKIKELCFWSDMSSDCGSLDNGRDRDLFDYENTLETSLCKRFNISIWELSDFLNERGW